MGRRVMDDETFGREWVAFWGPVSGSRIIGWMVLSAIKLGREEPSREALLQRGWGSTATRYRNVSNLMAFREAMEAKGYTFADLSELREARSSAELVAASA